MYKSVEDRLEHGVHNRVRSSAWDSVLVSVLNSVGRSVLGIVRGTSRKNYSPSIPLEVIMYKSVEDRLNRGVSDLVLVSVWSSSERSVRRSVENSFSGSVGDIVDGNVLSIVKEELSFLDPFGDDYV